MYAMRNTGSNVGWFPATEPGKRRIGRVLVWLMRAGLVAVTVFLVYFNYRVIAGERHFTQTRLWASIDPIQALVAINEAYKGNPLESRYRIQLIVSLEHARAAGKGVRIGGGAADRAYRIASSASPYHQAVLVSRAQHLINTDQWRGGEMAGIIRKLKRYARTHGEAWLIIGYHQGLMGFIDYASLSFITALDNGAQRESVESAARRFNLEITEQ